MLNPLVVAISINILIVYCIVMDIIDNKKGKRKTYKNSYQYYDDNEGLNNVDNQGIIKMATAVTSAIILAMKEIEKVDK
ncbi:hypothetical protein [Clostridium disporicum]|uniref:hypothetical protein n=1 Tax=Clostridium disporicum TaxID=84024 RepID=UPI0034A4F3FF